VRSLEKRCRKRGGGGHCLCSNPNDNCQFRFTPREAKKGEPTGRPLILSRGNGADAGISATARGEVLAARVAVAQAGTGVAPAGGGRHDASSFFFVLFIAASMHSFMRQRCESSPAHRGRLFP